MFVLCGWLMGDVSAEQSGDFTYTDNGPGITITDYPESGTGTVVIPGVIAGKPVTNIGNQAFASCAGISGVTIPTSVTVIGDGAFSNCVGLGALSIPSSVDVIGAFAFSFCSNLTSMVIPSGVTSVGGSAFIHCTSLVSVVIPSGVPGIGPNTFESCTALTALTIPYSVVTIGDEAFKGCSSLPEVYIPTNSACTIGVNVFEGCSALQEIRMNAPNPSYATQDGVLFNKAKTTLLVYPRGKAGSYVIPSGVTFIGNEGFRFCGGVTSIGIPISVAGFAEGAFSGCGALTSFTVNPGSLVFQSGTGPLYSVLGGNLMVYPGGLGGDVVIPPTVTTVSASAFRYNEAITSVTFPVGTVSVGDRAFANCGQLESAMFEGIAPIVYFGVDVFAAADPAFSVFFNSTATTGFAVPVWNGYPASAVGPDASVVNWLLTYLLPSDSSMTSDMNGDGVSLLMAYALNLDPNQNLATSVPQPVFTAGDMSMSFHVGADGVTYVVEVSPDLVNWGSEGVTESQIGLVRTASASRSGTSRFMRLSVSY